MWRIGEVENCLLLGNAEGHFRDFEIREDKRKGGNGYLEDGAGGVRAVI
jgi:hypothetical protein